MMIIMSVKIYTTNHCPYCVMAKEFFKKNDVAYTEINVEEDEAAAEEMIEKSGQMGVPVIVIGDKLTVGFDQERLQELLAV